MIDALGYVGVATDRLDDWKGFGADWLGMQLVDRSRAGLAFRMDNRKQRLLVTRGSEEDAQFFGWEVADRATLDALAAHLERHAIAVQRMPRVLADERHIGEGIVFADPAGNRIEAFCEPETASDPFKPGRPISGFRTGPLGMGHVVMQVRDLEAGLVFYRDVLGFRLSDWILDPFVAYFFHVNPRHHSFALIKSSRDGVMHHLMVELFSLDDVGRAYDMALGEGGRIGTTLGRHTNDLMTSFYARTPSDFLVEYGWGGKTLDVGAWQPYEVEYGPSLWGHERSWLPPEGRAEAKKFREKAARDGLREPVQVMPGNYEVTRGVCPWWDGLKAVK